MTEAEGRAIGERLLRVADPGLISLLMKGDELVGFVLAYPDIWAAIQRCRGQMWPTGWSHLLWGFRRTRWINFNGAGIRKAYRGLGGNAVLYAELYRILIEHPQYDFADIEQTQETNTRMMQELQAMGLEIHKRHRLYQRSSAQAHVGHRYQRLNLRAVLACVRQSGRRFGRPKCKRGESTWQWQQSNGLAGASAGPGICTILATRPMRPWCC